MVKIGSLNTITNKINKRIFIEEIIILLNELFPYLIYVNEKPTNITVSVVPTNKYSK